MSKTKIEWTHPQGYAGAVWNPVVGCRRVSPGCEHCYAETMAGRLARMGQARYLDVVKVDDKGQPRGRWSGTFREVPEVLDLPLRTRRPTCYFVNSMSDLFGEGVRDEWIAAVFGVMAACPQHRFLILTKRAERMARWFHRYSDLPAPIGVCVSEAQKALHGSDDLIYPQAKFWDGRPVAPTWPLPNVWIGTTVEDQKCADERLPELLRVPAVVRFVSLEPLLGDVNLGNYLRPRGVTHIVKPGSVPPERMEVAGIDWCIVGGESGPGARPFDLAWARSIRDQSKAAGAACFVKQLGARPVIDDAGAAALGCQWERDRLLGRHYGGCDEQGRRTLFLVDKKGGDPGEWPADLRVREFPTPDEER